MKQVPCAKFNEGNCLNGDKCQFHHDFRPKYQRSLIQNNTIAGSRPVVSRAEGAASAHIPLLKDPIVNQDIEIPTHFSNNISSSKTTQQNSKVYFPVTATSIPPSSTLLSSASSASYQPSINLSKHISQSKMISSVSMERITNNETVYPATNTHSISNQLFDSSSLKPVHANPSSVSLPATSTSNQPYMKPSASSTMPKAIDIMATNKPATIKESEVIDISLSSSSSYYSYSSPPSPTSSSLSTSFASSSAASMVKEPPRVKKCDIGCGEDGSVVCPRSLHSFCKDCFQSMVKSQLGKGNKDLKFICQLDGCGDPPFDLRDVLGNLSGDLLVDMIKLVQDLAIQKGEEMERSRQQEKAMQDAQKSELERKLDRVRLMLEDYATRKCPKCQGAYDDFTGCSSVQCECQAYFCGYCELLCVESLDCHEHVRQCYWNPFKGSYHAERDEWLEANRRCKALKMKPVLDALDRETREHAEKDKTIANLMREHYISFIYVDVGKNNLSIEELLKPNPGEGCPAGHKLTSFLTANDSFTCDGCFQKQKLGAHLHGCRRCNFDLCISCVNKRKQNHKVALAQPHCPNDHILRHFRTPTSTYTCDVCNKSQALLDEMYGCRQCNYDTCRECYDLLVNSAKVEQPEPLTCPNQHALAIFTVERGKYGCNICHKESPLYSRMYGCRACDYDICMVCYEKMINGEGIFVDKSVYCPSNHVVKKIRYLLPRHACSKCLKMNGFNSLMYSCRTCNFDLCSKCFNSFPSGFQDVYEKQVNCVMNHPLRSFVTFGRSHVCSNCKKNQPGTTRMFGCRLCNYDLCVKCFYTR